jgi:hypothetical protein
MRSEHAAAYAMGIGLPLLEALRRRTVVDDFVAGARPLAGAWGVSCGGLHRSFSGRRGAAAALRRSAQTAGAAR